MLCNSVVVFRFKGLCFFLRTSEVSQSLRELLQYSEVFGEQLDTFGSQIGELSAKVEASLDGIDDLKSDFVKQEKRRELSGRGGHRPKYPGPRRHTPGEVPLSHRRPFPKMDEKEVRAEERRKRVREEREKGEAAIQDRRKRRPDNQSSMVAC